MLRPRNLVREISNPAKKITGSGKCPSLTGNKLLGLQTVTCYHRFLGRSNRLRDSVVVIVQVGSRLCGYHDGRLVVVSVDSGLDLAASTSSRGEKMIVKDIVRDRAKRRYRYSSTSVI